MKDIIFKTLMLKGEAGSTIVSMEKTGHSGTIDTYTITFDDGSTTDIYITNLSSVESIELTSQTDTEDTYTVTLSDGSTQSFSVLNHNADIEAISEELAEQAAKVVEYNILDYAGDTLNDRWNAMKQDFVTWEYKHVLIPYPRENCSACVKVGNDWKWKLSAPIVFDDACNCIDFEIYGEIYAVSALSNALLFDDVAKPENVNFTNGLQIRGNRHNGFTIGCAIEVRAGARINFFGQTIINDCNYGIIVGGDNQSAPSEAYFDRVQVGFFDTNAVYVKGNTYPSMIYADHMEFGCAQQSGLDCVLLSGNCSNTQIGYLNYGTDIAKDGYATYDAHSVFRCKPTNGKAIRNIIVDYIYATNADYGAYLERTNSSDGSMDDVHLGDIGVAGQTGVNGIALYARYCDQLVVDRIKSTNNIDIANCYRSRIGRGGIIASDSVDRFAGLNAVVNIDEVTGVNDTPSISNKEIGAITIVKNANGKKVYINDGDAHIQIDGQMFVPAISSLPTPAWNLRGKMYRVNNDSGQDVIAVCIRYGGNSHRWFDLIAGTVI